MASKDSTIKEIDIKNIDINLTEFLSDIRNYEGFINCNSPFIGGSLNNVYKHKISIPEGRNLIRIKDGNVYTWKFENDGFTIYKNDEVITTLSEYEVSIRPYTPPDIKETESHLIVNGCKIPFTINDSYSYITDNDSGIITLSVCPRTSRTIEEFKKNLKTYLVNPNGTFVESVHKKVIIYHTAWSIDTFLQSIIVNSDKTTDEILGMVNHIQIDPAGIIVEAPSRMWIYYYKQGWNPDNIKCLFRIGICKSDNKIWERGEFLPIGDKLKVLYYNKYISGISINNSVITYDVDRLIERSSDELVYANPKGEMFTVREARTSILPFTVDDDFIYFYTTDYENTYSFKTGKIFCRSDDYNDRTIVTNTTMSKGFCASGYKSNAQIQNYPNFATIYPSVMSEIGSSYQNFLPDYPEVHDIEIFTPNTSGGAAYYNKNVNLTENEEYIDSSLDGTYFPVTATGNQLYNTPLQMKIQETYINEKIGKVGNGSYILAKSQNQENILGYYEFTLSEIENVFLIQGGFYGVSDKFIYSLSIEDSTLNIDKVVANKLDLVFLGAFPNLAMFYSKLDKSIYSFTADNTMNRIKEAYRINEIYSVFCDPSRLTLIISTNIGTIIIYQNQSFLLEDIITKSAIYYDSNKYIVGDYILSLSKQDGLEPELIKFQTEFYGEGSFIKSVNDCVYIKLTEGEIKNGYLKISSYALGDICSKTETKEFKFKETDFDEETGLILLRYQPQYQAASGFSVKIETTNPVVEFAISHKAEAIQNTKFNM